MAGHLRRADGRDRTGDIRFTRAVLYQLSYVGIALRIVPPSAVGGRGSPAGVADRVTDLCEDYRDLRGRYVMQMFAGQAALAPAVTVHGGVGYRKVWMQATSG
jgi:hypothetical protein